MAWVIMLLETAAGVATEFDGQYVKAYDPTYHPPGEEYDGGILEVTPHIEEALMFETSAAAFAKWRQAYGVRSDGMPNRPLSAWTIECQLYEGEARQDWHGAVGDGVERRGEASCGEAREGEVA
jgi:hypothetical protein